jgi:hypothetical protein|tara:strand:- start:50 stop:238 length:189 start_codon:yes stop_codon:yes gene_type:complete
MQMYKDDELPIIDLKAVKKMDGLAKTDFMNDLFEEYQDDRNSNPMRLFYSDLLSILVKNHGH